MLISTRALQKALEKYRKAKKEDKENYNKWDVASAGFATGAFLVVAVIFFLLELLVLFFAIGVALRCTKGGPERIVHVVLAMIFTLPYMLLTVFFSKCGTDVLRGHSSGNMVLLPSPQGGSFDYGNKLN